VSDRKDELRDAFLAEVAGDAADLDALALALGTGAIAPPASMRDRILAEARHEGRFARFAPEMGKILGIAIERAQALLDAAHDPKVWVPSPVPGIELYHLEVVPNAINGLVRLAPELEFPEHSHLGDETVMVLQGSYVDKVSGIVYRPGDVHRMPSGSTHAFKARRGPQLLYLALVHDGVTVGAQTFRPDDL
jgi:quercetin dioxygenase-like cupin family protein